MSQSESRRAKTSQNLFYIPLTRHEFILFLSFLFLLPGSTIDTNFGKPADHAIVGPPVAQLKSPSGSRERQSDAEPSLRRLAGSDNAHCYCYCCAHRSLREMFASQRP